MVQPYLVRVCAYVALLQGPAKGTMGQGDGAAQGPCRMTHVPWAWGSLCGDIMCVLPLGCGMQRPHPGMETLSTHGQWGPSPGSSMAEGMWVTPVPTPSPCRVPLNPPLLPQPCWQRPRQDERDGQRQPRQPQPLRLRHPSAPRRGPCQTARRSLPEHLRAPCPPQDSVPPAREGAGPWPQDPQAQRHWQS